LGKIFGELPIHFDNVKIEITQLHQRSLSRTKVV